MLRRHIVRSSIGVSTFVVLATAAFAQDTEALRSMDGPSVTAETVSRAEDTDRVSRFVDKFASFNATQGSHGAAPSWATISFPGSGPASGAKFHEPSRQDFGRLFIDSSWVPLSPLDTRPLDPILASARPMGEQRCASKPTGRIPRRPLASQPVSARTQRLWPLGEHGPVWPPMTVRPKRWLSIIGTSVLRLDAVTQGAADWMN